MATPPRAPSPAPTRGPITPTNRHENSTSNIQRSTFNVQCPIARAPAFLEVGRWKLDVERSPSRLPSPLCPPPRPRSSHSARRACADDEDSLTGPATDRNQFDQHARRCRLDLQITQPELNTSPL